MPPPWLVTIPIDKLKEFGAPALPSNPQRINPADYISVYAPISKEIQRSITAAQGEPFERASQAFARLRPNSTLPGFNWRLIVFRSGSSFAFSVPDETIFVSDWLVNKLSGDELPTVHGGKENEKFMGRTPCRGVVCIGHEIWRCGILFFHGLHTAARNARRNAEDRTRHRSRLALEQGTYQVCAY